MLASYGGFAALLPLLIVEKESESIDKRMYVKHIISPLRRMLDAIWMVSMIKFSWRSASSAESAFEPESTAKYMHIVFHITEYRIA